MTTWYKSVKGGYSSVDAVEVIRETAQQVVLKNGRRAHKVSDYESYFQTWEEAKADVVAYALRRVEAARNSLAYYEKRHEESQAITNA